MILLDTNVLSEWMKASPNQSVIGWLDRQEAGALFIPAVAKSEIETGIAVLPEGRRKERLRRAAAALFAEFEKRCLSLDCQAAADYAEVVATAKGLGRPISVEDAMIAATAKRYGLELATRNVKDFDYLPGLRLINPWLVV